MYNAAVALVQGKISALLVLSKMQLPLGLFMYPSVETESKKKRKKNLTKEEESGLKDKMEKCKRRKTLKWSM